MPNNQGENKSGTQQGRTGGGPEKGRQSSTPEKGTATDQPWSPGSTSGGQENPGEGMNRPQGEREDRGSGETDGQDKFDGTQLDNQERREQSEQTYTDPRTRSAGQGGDNS